VETGTIINLLAGAVMSFISLVLGRQWQLIHQLAGRLDDVSKELRDSLAVTRSELKNTEVLVAKYYATKEDISNVHADLASRSERLETKLDSLQRQFINGPYPASAGPAQRITHFHQGRRSDDE